ncbi:hypothetical protein FRB96_005138 [Tulasnella sp. 330]|nr:hypothetical protein FRB96_005138 [Tulasnella sp. 330]KAG8878890.1 hypothetical protein FRB97_002127 [Tulasnella sp. 331]KAG8887262.1 hypothetical protein FRB98_000299 [Tulasnella sp. 332]
MVRVTNAGLSRGYIKAGFHSFTAGDKSGADSYPSVKGERSSSKHKRRATEPPDNDDAPRLSKKQRLNRKEQSSSIECSICRKIGHDASECRKAGQNSKHKAGATKADAPQDTSVSKFDGGICYRCGSTKHRLKACKKRKDPANLHPFATCSICTNKGHLTSACPKNPKRNKELAKLECCKLCGGTAHAAQDCPMHGPKRLEGQLLIAEGHGSLHHPTEGPLSAIETRNGDIFLGPDPTLTTADEDDFHILRRRHDEVTRDEIAEKRMQRLNEAAEQASQRTSAIVKQPVSMKKAKVVTF